MVEEPVVEEPVVVVAPAEKPAEAETQKEQLFLRSAAQLQPKAAALFRSLLKIHTTPNAGISFGERQEKVAIQNRATLRRRVGFGHGATGVDDITASQLAQLAKSLGKRVDGFLVVGYADTTGTSEQNRAISEKRASSVVRAMTDSYPGTLSLQATSLGSTEKFDSQNLSKNRIVEIWSFEGAPAEEEPVEETSVVEEPVAEEPVVEEPVVMEPGGRGTRRGGNTRDRDTRGRGACRRGTRDRGARRGGNTRGGGTRGGGTRRGGNPW